MHACEGFCIICCINLLFHSSSAVMVSVLEKSRACSDVKFREFSQDKSESFDDFLT